MSVFTEAYIQETRTSFIHGSDLDQKRILENFKAAIAVAEWKSIASHNGEIAMMLRDLVESCAPTVARLLQSVLKLGVHRYEKEISKSELTCFHGALASQCLQFNLIEPEDVLELRYLERHSQDIVPLISLADVAQYFEDCAKIRSQLGEWKDAAIHAALSLTTSQSLERYRRWYVTELIANSEVTMLPRAVWPNILCPVMSDLGQLFETKSRSAWHELLAFCDKHSSDFEEWDLQILVRRAKAAYAVDWIRSLAKNVSTAPVSLLLDPIVKSGLTTQELMNAGLNKYCELRDGTLITCDRPLADSFAAGSMLENVAHLSSCLQSEVYKQN